jgi:tetratricopeptide (TPR) repeat protein
MRSAGIAYDRGDIDEAIPLYEQEITENPTNPQAYFELGNCYRLKGDYKKMSEMFDKSLDNGDKFYNQIFDTRDSLWIKFFNLGVPLFNERKYEEALPYFEKAVIIDPENSDGYNERGMCYLQVGEKEKAAEDFKTVIKFDEKGENITVRLNLASIYFKNKDYDSATPLYSEVLKFQPDNVLAISKLALIYQEKGDSEKAIQLYEKVIDTKKDDPDLWFNLGILYFQMDRFDEAIKSFNKVVEINPDDVESLMNLVNSLWKAEMFKEAVPYLEKVVEIQPDYADAWRFLSVAYVKAGQVKEGKKALEKFKELTDK